MSKVGRVAEGMSTSGSLIRPASLAVTGILVVACLLAIPSVLAEPTSILDVGLGALYGVVGTLLAIRRPRDPTGWIFLGILLVFSTSAAADSFGGAAVQAGGPLPSGLPLALIWVETWIYVVLFGLYYLLTLVFPSGHLPRGRLGRLAQVSLLVPVAAIVVTVSGPHLAGIYAPDSLGRALDNPVGFLPFPDGLAGLLTIGTVVLLTCGVVAMVVRFRRARGIERQQLKWVVAALVLTGVLVVAAIAVVVIVPRVGASAWILALLGYASIPLAVGIAIFRYRLYEIDRIVSRTIGWAVVTGVLAVVFVVIVLAIGSALASFTSSNTLAVAASTLVVAALFRPLRERVQGTVDRRFNRARYDAERTVAVFAGRLRDEVDLDQIGSEITAAVTRTVQPSTVSLWLRG